MALWRQVGLIKRLHIFEELFKERESEVIIKLTPQKAQIAYCKENNYWSVVALCFACCVSRILQEMPNEFFISFYFFIKT